MIYIATITDKDVFPEKTFPEVSEWARRKTVKIILKNEKGEIALVANPIHKCHLLPGGGINAGEDVLRAGDRECREEVKYSIGVAEEIGVIEEYRARDGKHYETYGLIANAKDHIPRDLRTDDEKKNELSVEWHIPKEVLALLEAQEKRLKAGEIDFYNTGFNILRDKLFFEHALSLGQIVLDPR
jgi:ADP-ribose pyrophosphatase YjhB (NUDIX family)